MAVTGYIQASVYAPDGTEVYNSCCYHGPEDSNGNYVDHYYGGTPGDTLGRVPVTTATNGNTITYTMANAQGNSTRVYTVKTGTISVHTNFGQSGVTEYSGTITVVNEIDLPDGTKYTFGYDSGTTAGHYGLLTSMTLPTGGQITYTWSPYTDSSGSKYIWINTRTTPDSSTAWNYIPNVVTTCGSGQVNCQQLFTVQKPNGDKTVYTSTLNGGAWASQIQYYNQTTLLSTLNQCWQYVGTIVSGQCPISSPVTGSPATAVQKLLSSTVLPILTGSISKTTQYSYDSYGNITMMEENNFYTGYLPSNPDRTTCISYLNSTNYVNALILNRPSTVTVVDNWSSTPCNAPPAAHIIAQTIYSYDGSALASATGKANHDDTNFGTSNTVRGNLTQVKRLVSGSTFLTTSMTYDMTGQVKTSTDTNGNVTQYDYTDNFYMDPGDGQNPSTKSVSPSTNAYLTKITYPTVNSVALTKKFGYFYGTGQIAVSTDANNNITYSHFYDSLNRPTSTALPNGGWTLFAYNSTETQVDAYTGTTNSSASTSCTGCRHDQSTLDGLGRITSNRLVSDPDGETYLDSTYDSVGRIATLSNPYRGSQNGVDTFSYDGLNRTTQVKHADNNIAQMSYGANAGSQFCFSSYGLGYPTLMVDEAGSKRQTWTDGFGRLIESDEPDSNGNLTVATCNYYDLNNNLTQVTSLGLTQTIKPTYTYDSISRVTSKTMPGLGTTYFYYNTSGGPLCSGDPSAICRRTDARNITTTYAYDALNRLASKSYSDGTLTAVYTYDQTYVSNSLGRLSSVGTYSGSTQVTGGNIDYDTIGNITGQNEQVKGIWGNIYYNYNFDGSLASLQYPSGRTVTYTEGNAQRMTSTMDQANNINYVTSPTSPTVMYAPQGGPQNMIFGKTGTFNGISEIRAYNNRLEVTGIEATSSAGTALNLSYSYVSGNNGDIATQTNYVTSGRTQNYTYDPLNRLLTAQTQASSGGDCWGQSFGNNGAPPTLAADALANLFYTSSKQCSSPSPQFTMNTSNNNQFTGTGIGYDSDGDMTQDTAYTYTYDAENRVITASGMTNGPYCYTYDANGMRVMKAHASGGSCNGTVTVDMLYWRDFAGNTIAETDGTGSTTSANYNEYIFSAGRRIAQSNPYSSNVYYYFADHLGSTRLVTTATGTACYEVDYLPYGTENTPSGFSNTCSTRYRFTGYERDLETAYGTSAGNDYAFARYYNSRLGRFMSGDPLDGDITDPQTLNKYAYVRDNPVNLVDPSGLFTCSIFYCPTGGGDPFDGGAPLGCNLFTNYGGWGCMSSFQTPAPPKKPSQVSPPKPKPNPQPCKATAGQRAAAGIQGTLNVALGEAKTFAAGGLAVLGLAGAPESGGASLTADVVAGYVAFSSQGQVMSGMGQLYTAFSGDLAGGQGMSQVGDIFSGPISGISTLIVTGNMGRAQSMANAESAITAGAGAINSKTVTGAIAGIVDLNMAAAALNTDSKCK
jgi:RHS repeat-associated protein